MPRDMTTPTAPPAEDPVQVALRDPRTLDELRLGARVLLRRARPGASQTLLAQLTDEAVSRTVETALTARFDMTRGTSVSAWLAGIVRNIVRKETRGRLAVAPGPAVNWDCLVVDTAPPPDEQAAARAEAEQVRTALGQLNPSDRQLLEMHYFDQLTAPEIGERLGEFGRHRPGLALPGAEGRRANPGPVARGGPVMTNRDIDRITAAYLEALDRGDFDALDRIWKRRRDRRRAGAGAA